MQFERWHFDYLLRINNLGYSATTGDEEVPEDDVPNWEVGGTRPHSRVNESRIRDALCSVQCGFMGNVRPIRRLACAPAATTGKTT